MVSEDGKRLEIFYLKVEELYYIYPCSINKGASEIGSYCEAELRLCFRIYAKCWFSHDVAHFISRLTGSCEELCFSEFDDKKFGFSASYDMIQMILFSGINIFFYLFVALPRVVCSELGQGLRHK